MKRFAIHALFFGSGASGLVYQVVWVRQFGNLFGNTVHSAALVTAIFMAGLGLGGFAAGIWADSLHRRAPGSTLRRYAHFELGIALLGLAVASALPRLEPLSARLSSYVRGTDGWYELSAGSQLALYGLAVALLLPITTLMGGTLTLLVRYLVREDPSLAGWRIGLLYGVNTAGAALGAFLVDFWLVPRLGLFASQSVAVLINLLVGIAAFAWSARDELPATTEPGPAGPTPSFSPGSRRILVAAALALALTGFSGMGLEILWFRYLTTVLGAHRATFSLLLAVILTGLWIGSILAGALHRRFGNPETLFLVAQAAAVALAIALLATFDPLAFDSGDLLAAYVARGELGRDWIEAWANLRVILRVVGLPALAMGCAYPLANAAIQRAGAVVAARAGLLYLANVAGAVAGALLTGFLFLPRLGIQSSLSVLALAGLLACAAIWPTRSEVPASRPSRALALVCGSIGALALAAWLTLPSNRLMERSFRPSAPNERALFFSEGINESIVVTEDATTGARRLSTNGFSMSGTSYGGQRYMRAFAHVPLLSLPAPERVLVICFGVGNTLGAASLHPSVERLEVVDLSRHVLEQAPLFARWNRNVLRDPRVAVFVNDGRQHLRMQPEGSYDLITLEPPPIGHAGVASLYSREFYELARERLREGGYLSQWLPAYQLPAPLVAALVRSFVEIFPDGVLLSGYRSELILLARKGGPPSIDPREIETRLAERPAVRADLEAVDLASPLELVGTYAGSARSLAFASADALPVTDDDPASEYSPYVFRHTVLDERQFAPESVSSWCPTCFDGGRPAASVRGLDSYLRSLGVLYRSPAFRTTSDFAPVRATPLPIDLADAEVAHVLESSGYLRRLFRDPARSGDR